MANSVPDTTTFGLQDVQAVIGDGDLQTCFANSIDSGFDDVYKGSKNGLYNFRNYQHVPPEVYSYLSNTHYIVKSTKGSVGGWDNALDRVRRSDADGMSHGIASTLMWSRLHLPPFIPWWFICYRTFMAFDLTPYTGTIYSIEFHIPLRSFTHVPADIVMVKAYQGTQVNDSDHDKFYSQFKMLTGAKSHYRDPIHGGWIFKQVGLPVNYPNWEIYFGSGTPLQVAILQRSDQENNLVSHQEHNHETVFDVFSRGRGYPIFDPDTVGVIGPLLKIRLNF